MELVEAAAVIGAVDMNRSYYGVDVSSSIDFGEMLINFTRNYCPVTLKQDWPSLWRLIFLLLFVGLGTFVNAFFVSAFFVARPLRQKGYVFLACLGLCDMMITSVVVPAAVVALISMMTDMRLVCRVMQFLTQAATYAYSVFFMLVAIETYCRLLGGTHGYYAFLTVPVWIVAVLNFCISFATSGVGVYFGLDYDYCNRDHYGSHWFRFVTTMTFYILPFVVTTVLLVYVSCVVRARTIRFMHYRRCAQYEDDYEFTNLNIGCYILFVACWIPYLIIINVYPDVSDGKFYSLVWLGIARTVVTSFLYSGINKHFRLAFSNLFYYMCCKTQMKMQETYYHRAVYNPKTKVHIIRQSSKRVVESREVPPLTL